MSGAGPCRAASALVVVCVTASIAAPARAQERERTCTLVLEPTTDSTESVSIEVEPDMYVTHVRGGLRWTCGAARMVADSAVRYEQDGRLEMIGSVDYRDSTRTLVADSVTYFERADRMEARGSVLLTRRATGSTLEGPRVEFLRISGDRARRTVATERPLLTLRRDTAASDTSPPVRVRGDRIVLRGDEEARVRGDVRIRRPDMQARSDSALFRMEEEVGELYGSPEVTGEAWRLRGETIRTGFEGGELRSVLAEEEAHATGEDFELFAPRIRARTEGREIERLWAYGEQRPVAYSPPYRLAADSLEFDFERGQIEELRALSDANAVEVGDEIPDEPRGGIALSPGDRSWVTADSITLRFAGPSAGADSAAAPGEGPAGVAVSDRAGTPTRVGADAGDPGILAPVDSLVDVTGPAPAAEETAAARPDSAPTGAEAASAGRTGSADGRQLRTLRAVGRARAYYLLDPDEAGDPPGIHYQLGREIVIHFEDGEAVRLEGKDAVGVHADPTGEGAPAGAPPDTSPPAPGDTVPPPPADTAGRDTAPAPPDTTPEPRADAARGERGRER